MDTLTLTVSGFISFVITAGAVYILHRMLVGHVGRLAARVEDIRLMNQITLQQYAFDAENRRKIQIVAELFALWRQTAPPGPGVPNRSFNAAFSVDDFSKLQQLSFECALWLPPEIFKHLSDRLANLPTAKDPKEILVEVRNYLNPNLGTITWTDIIHF
jgi:hypothetical protein